MASQNSSVEANLVDISKMKVVDIKRELKSKGLSTAGTKTELVQRLQAANTQTAQDLISDDGNGDPEIIDEDEVLGGGVDEEEDFDDDDLTADAVLGEEPKAIVAESTIPSAKRPAETPQEAQPKKRVLVRPVSTSTKENNEEEKSTNEEINKEKTDTSEKKIVKLTSVSSVKERLELRAQKFGTPLSEAAKKEARAARFGISSTTPSKISQITTSTKITIVGPSEDILRKRAERFGGNVSSLALKAEESEKLKKRQERFGLSAATAQTLDEKKKLRAERFKL